MFLMNMLSIETESTKTIDSLNKQLDSLKGDNNSMLVKFNIMKN